MKVKREVLEEGGREGRRCGMEGEVRGRALDEWRIFRQRWPLAVESSFSRVIRFSEA